MNSKTNLSGPSKTTNRGVRLFNRIINDEDETPTLPKHKYSRRDPLLINARDNFLLHRAYYKTKIQRKNYPDTFTELITEVFLSKAQIQKIIQSKGEALLTIKKQQPTISHLKKQWPYINW